MEDGPPDDALGDGPLDGIVDRLDGAVESEAQVDDPAPRATAPEPWPRTGETGNPAAVSVR
ncbi:hypothetical protein GCM10010299_11030 [Streptomyces tanashiensis]|nr:hypothetical protein GCM10010299_11030 [Streptomyces tanashiensis]